VDYKTNFSDQFCTKTTVNGTDPFAALLHFIFRMFLSALARGFCLSLAVSPILQLWLLTI